jgi:branched-chain amino acid transport system permease protein
MTGTFIAPSHAVRIPNWLTTAAVLAAIAVPFIPDIPYVLQVLTNAWLAAMLAISLTLVAGTLGQVSLGHAALLLIGAYASALLALDSGLPVWAAIPAAGVLTAIIGTALIAPAFRLRSHYVSIATLGVGEIVGLVILNWESLTRGPMGVTNIPALAVGTLELDTPQAAYWVTLAVLVVLAMLQSRLLRSHLGRTFRAIRDDDVAARAYGVSLGRYKAIAFGFAGFGAGVAGAISAHLYSYINNETFTSTVSISALTMVIFGGMGNLLGAVIGAVALTALPEMFRGTAEYRMLIYGAVLLLLIRFRPQGVLGTV